jgi:hypothetical protein
MRFDREAEEEDAAWAAQYRPRVIAPLRDADELACH